MATVRNLKIKSSTCKRIIKELHSYEKEVEREASKTAEMKDNGADPYDLKQQWWDADMLPGFLEIPHAFTHCVHVIGARAENVLAESRMMIPDCCKRLEASLADLKQTLTELKESNQKEGVEIEDARSSIAEVELFFQSTEA